MNSKIKIDNDFISVSSFTFPAMSLSSARTNMRRHEFQLILNPEETAREMNKIYQNWVELSKIDDTQCGSPQDELAIAGYPELIDLLKDEELTLLALGNYLVRELFEIMLPDGSSERIYWFDKVTGCEITEDDVILYGICYSRK